VDGIADVLADALPTTWSSANVRQRAVRPVITLWTRWLAAPPGLEVVMMRPDSFHPELVSALGWIKTRNGFPASSSIPRIGHSFSGLSSGHVR
jgi:hypothetical protein